MRKFIAATAALLFGILPPTVALADKFEVRYETASAGTSVFVEVNRGAVDGSSAATAEASVCAMAWQYVSRGAITGVRVWHLTDTSTQAAMTRLGGVVCRAIEQGATEP